MSRLPMPDFTSLASTIPPYGPQKAWFTEKSAGLADGLLYLQSQNITTSARIDICNHQFDMLIWRLVDSSEKGQSPNYYGASFQDSSHKEELDQRLEYSPGNICSKLPLHSEQGNCSLSQCEIYMEKLDVLRNRNIHVSDGYGHSQQSEVILLLIAGMGWRRLD